jgi:hypothetical protein
MLALMEGRGILDGEYDFFVRMTIKFVKFLYLSE